MERKLFVGYRLNFDINPDEVFPLIKIPIDGKEYIGSYLKTPVATYTAIQSAAASIDAILQPKVPFLLRKHSLHIIAELLLGGCEKTFR